MDINEKTGMLTSVATRRISDYTLLFLRLIKGNLVESKIRKFTAFE